MKKETAKSIGLRRWRVVECSSRASAKTRFCSSILGGGKTKLHFGLPPGYTSSRKRYCSLNMKPPKNIFLAEFCKQMKKTAKVPRSSLAINFYLPGHCAVSDTDSLLRERLGQSLSTWKTKFLIQRFKAFLS